MSQFDQISVDIETVDTAYSACVLQIGVVLFSLTGVMSLKKSFYLDLESQIAAGRSVNDSTIAWWERTNKDLLEALLSHPEKLPLEKGVKAFVDFLLENATGEANIWAKGPTFDICILRSLFESAGRKFPFNFRQERCVRTIQDLAGVTDEKVPVIYHRMGGDKHDGLHDAAFQASIVRYSYDKLMRRAL